MDPFAVVGFCSKSLLVKSLREILQNVAKDCF